MKLLDFPLHPGQCVCQGESPGDVVAPVLTVDHGHLQPQAHPVLPKHHGVPHLQGPILPGLVSVHLNAVAEHDHSGAILLVDHQPEIINSIFKGS